MLPAVADGMLTNTVYTLIRDTEWDQALALLKEQLAANPTSRAALSLTAFCSYNKGDFETAVRLYAELAQRYPAVQRYQLALANTRLKAGLYHETLTIKGDSQDAVILRAYAKHELDDTTGLQLLVDQLTRGPTDDPRIICMKGNQLLKAERYAEALEQYDAALVIRKDPRIYYAKALANFRESNFPECLKALGELVDLSARLYPDLVSAASCFHDTGGAGAGGRAAASGSVNPHTLLSSALIEAFNLKAAVEWVLGDHAASEHALDAMPPRPLEELDPITLHNKALAEIQTDPSMCVRKLQFLITQPPFPVEAFTNLISIYVQHGLFDLAADLIAENRSLALTTLDPDKLSFFETVVGSAAGPEESYSKLETLKNRYASALRRICDEITQARGRAGKGGRAGGAGGGGGGTKQQGGFNSTALKNMSRAEIAVNTLLQQYEAKLSLFIPMVMWQAGILYDVRRYKAAVKTLRGQEDLCEEHPAFVLNLAHIMFAAEEYDQAADLYRTVLDATPSEDILSVPAIALANLCTSLILLNRNAEAEKLMQLTDQAEIEFMGVHGGAGKPPLHLCVINLVIGTLYSVKGNILFGISRILKALEPIGQRLSPDAWMYSKRPLLALAEACALSLGGPVEEGVIDNVIMFLDEVIRCGREIPIAAAQVKIGIGKETTVADEARALKALFLQFCA